MYFTVRLAQAEDAESLSAFIRGLGMFERLRSEDSGVTGARVAQHLAMSLADDSHSLYVATSASGALLAYSAVHWLPYLFLTGPEGYLSELFVTEEARGRGLGTSLLETVVEEARARGCSRLLLGAVKSRESYSRGFYQARGWIEREDIANMVLEL